jgi:hypothetical protein
MRHSEVADSFCAGCLAGVDRLAAVRRAAFLRRRYATRRLRFMRTRSCCPIEPSYGLKIGETQWVLNNSFGFFSLGSSPYEKKTIIPRGRWTDDEPTGLQTALQIGIAFSRD